MTLYRKDVITENSEHHCSFSVKKLSLWKAVACEFFGSFMLVFIGSLPLLCDNNWIVSGVCFAGVLVTLIHIIGPTSGCNVSPAVTLAFVAVRRLHPIKGCLYFIAQMLGAIAGAGYLYLAAPSDWTKKYQLGLTSFDPEEVNWVQAVQIESAATLLLVLLMLVISDPDENREFEGFPALSSGLALISCFYAAYPYTGASLNPARSFGPALLTLNFKQQWVYWIGPLTGSLLGVVIYKMLLVKGVPRCSSKERSVSLGGESEDPNVEEQQPRRIRPEA